MSGLSDFPTAIDSYAADVDGETNVLAEDVNEGRDFAIAAQAKIGTDTAALSSPTLEGRAKYQEAGGLKRHGSSVASATSITLTDAAQVFPISGTMNIATIAAPSYPRVVLLEFSGALLLVHGTGNLTLPGASDIAVSAGSSIWLEWAGSTWRVAGGAGADAASLQGRPVHPAAPGDDDVLGWVDGEWVPSELGALLPVDPVDDTIPALHTIGDAAHQAADGAHTHTPVVGVTVAKDGVIVNTTPRAKLNLRGVGIAGVADDPTHDQVSVDVGGGGSGGGSAHGILGENGTPAPDVLTPRGNLLFEGFMLADDVDEDATRITAPTPGHVLMDEALALAQEPNLALLGAGVTAEDDAATQRTKVTIPGVQVYVPGSPSPIMLTNTNKLYIRGSVSVSHNAGLGMTEVVVGGGGGGYPTIYDETTPVLPTRSAIAFQGAGVTVTDDSGDGATLVTIPGGGLSNPMTTQDDLIVGGSSGTPGRLAKGSDGQVLTVDPSTHHLVWATPGGGGSGDSNGQLTPKVVPSVASTLTLWGNQGSATATDQSDGLLLQGPASTGAGDLHCLLQAFTAGRKTTLGFIPAQRWVNVITVGLVITDGTVAGTSKALAFGLAFNSGWTVNVVHYPTINSSSGTADYTETPVVVPPIVWLQVDDTGGTNFVYRISLDGQNWVPIFSAGRTGILTATHCGIFVSSNISNVAPALKAVHWTHV